MLAVRLVLCDDCDRSDVQVFSRSSVCVAFKIAVVVQMGVAVRVDVAWIHRREPCLLKVTRGAVGKVLTMIHIGTFESAAQISRGSTTDNCRSCFFSSVARSCVHPQMAGTTIHLASIAGTTSTPTLHCSEFQLSHTM